MFALWRQRHTEAPRTTERLNQLETRLQRLELDNAERQVAVLSSLEKVLHQLRAREVKRVRDGNSVAGEEAAADPERVAEPAARPSARVSTAHLSRRFRVGGD